MLADHDIAAIIQVRVDTSSHYPKFLAKVAACTEVLECHAITGEASHLLKVRTRNTESLERLLGEIQRWPGVVLTRTNLILSTHKEETALPLDHARDVVDLSPDEPSEKRNGAKKSRAR